MPTLQLHTCNACGKGALGFHLFPLAVKAAAAAITPIGVFTAAGRDTTQAPQPPRGNGAQSPAESSRVASLPSHCCTSRGSLFLAREDDLNEGDAAGQIGAGAASHETHCSDRRCCLLASGRGSQPTQEGPAAVAIARICSRHCTIHRPTH
ncbi:hypothetical protein Tsubulata_016183 [Turnera subulata]|uniref:Uncharacterized protein n=1 Tax=Turnera subulata TaxID=218843 RepID=A0A9Q0GH00_9ROSI|nr:hypothetical protein Tsubulata_016183 [Turnera subulata]